MGDISAHNRDNPNRVIFSKKNRKDWIKIHADRTTIIERPATEEDKIKYKDYLPKLGRPKKDDAT